MFDKIKRLSKDTLLYGLSIMLGRFINFVLVPFYTNIFDPAEYGVVAHLYAYVAFLSVAYIYGMDAAYLKFASLPELKSKRKETFSTILLSIFTTTAILTAALAYFAPSVGGLMNLEPARVPLIYWVGAIVALDALCWVPFIHLRLKNKALLFSTIKVVSILLNVGLNILLIVVWGWGIEAIFISNVAASALSLLWLAPYVVENFAFRFDWTLYKRFMKFGFPYFPASVAAVLMQVVDRPIVERLAGRATLGVYQANYKMGVFMMLFVSMFQYAWQPFFLQSAEEPGAKKLFAKVFTLFALAGAVILVSVSLFIPDIIQFQIAGKSLIGWRYWGGLHIIPIILLGYLFYGFYVNFVAGLYIREKSLPAPIIMGACAAINVGANVALVPEYGVTGAALATLAAYFAMALGFFVVTRRYYRIDYEWGKIGRIFLAVGVVAAAYYLWLAEYAPVATPGGDIEVLDATWFEKIGLLAAFAVLLALSRAVEIDEIKRVIARLRARNSDKTDAPTVADNSSDDPSKPNETADDRD